MDFDLTSEQQAVQQMVRNFADKEIVPHARANDEKCRFPMETFRKMGPLGILGGPVPKEYGGAGLDYVSHAIVTEEIGRACSSLRTTLSVQISLVALTITRWGTEEQKQKYLPELCSGEKIGCFGLTEPDSGSDAAAMRSKAVVEDGGWRLNGSKMWISNGGIADVALIFAQTDFNKKHKGLIAFIIDTDTEGFSSQDIHGKLGMRSSNTASLHFDNIFIPDSHVVGEVGDGFKIAMSALDNGRYSVAAGSVGICQASLEASVKYAKEREQFGKPIASFQLVQELIAEMAVDTESSRLLTFRAGHLKNKGERGTRESSMCKFYATEAAIRCANNAIQVHGGYGYSNEYPVERYLRDARVGTLYEGTSQIHKLILGYYETGIRAFVATDNE